MRKVIYALAYSCDNFIVRYDDGGDCILMDDELLAEFPKFCAAFDTVLMGRKTYDHASSQSHGGTKSNPVL